MDNAAEKNIDTRVRKTRLLLRRALTQLMKEKPVNEISVREISDMCDLNRGTFYLHYKDVYDMVESLEREIGSEFSQMLSTCEVHTNEDMLEMMKAIFRFIEQNRDICEAILGKYGNMAFVRSFSELVKEKYVYLWNEAIKTDRVKFDRSFRFVVSGVIGVLQDWLASDFPEPPDEIAELVYHLVFRGIRALPK